MLSEIQLRLVHRVVLFLLAASMTSLEGRLEQHGLALLLCRYLVDREHVRLVSRRLRSIHSVRTADGGLVDTRAEDSRLLLRQRVLMLQRLLVTRLVAGTCTLSFLFSENAIDQVFCVALSLRNTIIAVNRLIIQLVTIAFLRSPL